MSMSKMFFNKPPLVIDKDLTELVGLHEAIILQQIHYWMEINTKANRNYQDGFYWTFNSYKEWQKQFPFWSERTIQRLILSLEGKGFLISANYNRLNLDKTKWYRIDYDKVSHWKATKCHNQNDTLSQPLPETTSEITSEKDNGGSRLQLFSLYKREIGDITPSIEELLDSLLVYHSEEEISYAIALAVQANVRSFRYIEGIVRRRVDQEANLVYTGRR